MDAIEPSSADPVTTPAVEAKSEYAAARREPVGAPADDLPEHKAPGRSIEMPKKKGFFARLFGR